MSDCSLALVQDVTVVNQNDVINLSIAWNLSEEAYSEAKKNAGANATIYGIPMGATYAEFKNNIQRRRESFGLQHFEKHSLSYATSSLSDNALQAYIACVRSKTGLELVTKSIGSNAYAVHLLYHAGPASPDREGNLIQALNVEAVNRQALQREIEQVPFGGNVDKEFLVIPEDPNEEVYIEIGIDGAIARVLTLPPLKFKPVAPRPLIEIRARDFVRSLNLEVGVLPYGADTIHNAAPYHAAPNMAEYNVSAPSAGKYQLEVKYAAASPRPVDVYVNNILVDSNALFVATGGWEEEKQKWHAAAVVDLVQGNNILRLQRSDVFPHIQSLRFTPIG